jgi:hypothetical protein
VEEKILSSVAEKMAFLRSAARNRATAINRSSERDGLCRVPSQKGLREQSSGSPVINAEARKGEEQRISSTLA